ncbi:hypothetical protein ACHAXH_004406 [Discostella pseudostelligera]
MHRLRTLKLTGCTNITGSGLMPLMGSAILEQIDLMSIVKWNKTLPANEQCVIPILNSIIDNATGNSFSGWADFIEKYDEFLEERGAKCSYCNEVFWGGMDGGGNPWVYNDHKSPLCRLQNYTCYECTDHVCEKVIAWTV